MTELNKLTDIDYYTLEEVAYHSKAVEPDDGVPVKLNIGVKLVATGHASFKECSYLKHLKRPELYTAIVLTTKGRRIADERDMRQFKVIEENVDGLLNSLEAKQKQS